MLIYLVLINIAAFLLYGYDKSCAVRGGWRISEAFLFGLALFGGSVGAYAGMQIFHHKTRKPRFMIGVPTVILLQCAMAVFLLLGGSSAGMLN